MTGPDKYFVTIRFRNGYFEEYHSVISENLDTKKGEEFFLKKEDLNDETRAKSCTSVVGIAANFNHR